MLVAITYDCWVVIVADKGCGQIGYRVHCHEVVNGLLGYLCRNKGSLEYLASCRLIKKKQQSQGASTTVCCLCTRSPHFQFLGLKPRRFPRVDAVKAVLRSNSGAAPVDDRNELRETHYCAIMPVTTLFPPRPRPVARMTQATLSETHYCVIMPDITPSHPRPVAQMKQAHLTNLIAKSPGASLPFDSASKRDHARCTARPQTGAVEALFRHLDV